MLRIVAAVAWLALSLAVVWSMANQRHDPGRAICAVVVSEECR